jgi:RNase P subunit RPR2
MPPRALNIDKLSDEFGQYEILLTCACGHTRRCYPHTLAAFAGWEAKLADVVKRMRCTKCDKKLCTAKTMRETAPRGYKSH